MALEREQMIAILELATDAFGAGKISEPEVQLISACVRDFNTAESLHHERIERLGGTPGTLDLPSIAQLLHLLQRGDYLAAVQEARNLTGATKMILLRLGSLLATDHNDEQTRH